MTKFNINLNRINFTLDEGDILSIDYTDFIHEGDSNHHIMVLLKEIKRLHEEKEENKRLAEEWFCGELGEIGFVGIRDYAAKAEHSFDWVRLHDAFMIISRANAECSKSSEGYMHLKFNPINYWEDDQKKVYPYIYLEFGGYQIGDWNRHQEFGPFITVKEAWDRAVKLVGEAFDLVNEELKEEGKPTLNRPFILIKRSED